MTTVQDPVNGEGATNNNLPDGEPTQPVGVWLFTIMLIFI